VSYRRLSAHSEGDTHWSHWEFPSLQDELDHLTTSISATLMPIANPTDISRGTWSIITSWDNRMPTIPLLFFDRLRRLSLRKRFVMRLDLKIDDFSLIFILTELTPTGYLCGLPVAGNDVEELGELDAWKAPSSSRHDLRISMMLSSEVWSSQLVRLEV
jgi:hypothetical protein